MGGQSVSLGIVAALVVFASVGTPAVGSLDSSVPVQSAGSSVQSNQSGANASTPRHENPGQSGEPSDVEAVRRWLLGRLTDSLRESVDRIERNEGRGVESVLGDQYAEWSRMFVGVSGNRSRSATRFRRAGETGTEYADLVRQYWTTHREYRQARRAGRDQRAKELAQELNRLALEIQRTGPDLESQFRTISNGSATDLTASADQISNVTETITRVQLQVRREAFVRTSLDVRVGPNRISFLDPLELTGRLTAVNGSGLANRTVEVRVDGRRIQTTTNESGWFGLTYRPVSVPTGPQNVTVAYEPNLTGAYLKSTHTARVRVEQTTPTIHATLGQSSVAFGRNLSISGTVTVRQIDAEGVPVTVLIGNERLGSTHTGANGVFALDAGVPLTVPAGNRSVRVVIPQDGRALASANDSIPVTVEPTATSLSLSGSREGARGVGIEGRLVTDGGTPIAEQRVVLRVDGRRVGTTTTGPDGRYATTVTVRPSRRIGILEVTAVYSGNGTNLKPSRARVVLQPDASQPFGVPISVWVLAGVALVAGSALGYRRLRQRRASPDVAEPDETTSADEEVTEPTTADESDEDVQRGIGAAREALAGGEVDTAVRTLYTVVQRRYADELGVEPRGTHREFLRACRRAGLGGEELALLRRVTDLIEQSEFGQESPESETVEAVLDEVAAQFEGERGSEFEGES